MLFRFDQGEVLGLRRILDTPDPDEDVFTAADHWLSELTSQEQMAVDVIAQLENMVDKW
jgi:hypothetical protein